MDNLKQDILNLVDGDIFIYALLCHSPYWSNGYRNRESIIGLYLHKNIAKIDCQIKCKLAKEDYERNRDSEDYISDSFSVEKLYINFKINRKEKEIKYNLATCKILPLLLSSEVYLIESEIDYSCLEKNIFISIYDATERCKTLIANFETDFDFENYHGYKVISIILDKKQIIF